MTAAIAAYLAGATAPREATPFVSDLDMGSFLVSELPANGEVQAHWTLTPGEHRRVTYGGATCSCMSASLDGRPIAPGETIELGSGVQRKFNVDIATGRIAGERHYAVVFRDEEGRKLQGRVRFQVLSDLVTVPDVVTHPAVENVDREAIKPLAVMLRSREGVEPATPQWLLPEGIFLKSMERSDPRPLESGIVEWRWDVRMELQRALFSGNDKHARMILPFRNDRREQFVQAIPFLIKPLPGIRAPSRVTLTRANRSAKVLLLSTDDATFKILEVRIEDRRIAAVPISKDAARSHSIQLSLAEAEAANFSAQIVVVTDHARTPRIAIAVESLSAP
jgi:hypothetical protein